MDIGGVCIFTIMNPKDISIAEYDYDLPESKIAFHPLDKRDASKLLIYKKGEIKESFFYEIDHHLPANTLLVFNNTKVINARIKFTKTTGANIEIFCLEPYGNIADYSTVMSSIKPVQWKCFVGGAAKWKDEILEKEITIGGKTIILKAAKIEKITEAFIIEFSWTGGACSFSEIIEAAGNIPLPPYIKRITGKEDVNRYQTIFAAHNGSVAAPTAGLHFSEGIFEKLQSKNITKAFVTLHVGAGTFKPVKADTMSEHEMHSEYLDVTIDAIKELKNNIGNVAAVGTTSLRTIESLYWFGVKVYLNENLKELTLKQWDVYSDELSKTNISANDALNGLVNWMQQNNITNIFTQTQILIAPGYKFRLANMLVTNFHQPKSTLLLLVAAAIGQDWKKMYTHALNNEYRFLSYGDGNLIFL
jgi:S-adenosylmethionine:tRNA ribosyltransferase-isomerase